MIKPGDLVAYEVSWQSDKEVRWGIVIRPTGSPFTSWVIYWLKAGVHTHGSRDETLSFMRLAEKYKGRI